MAQAHAIMLVHGLFDQKNEPEQPESETESLEPEPYACKGAAGFPRAYSGRPGLSEEEGPLKQGEKAISVKGSMHQYYSNILGPYRGSYTAALGPT